MFSENLNLLFERTHTGDQKKQNSLIVVIRCKETVLGKSIIQELSSLGDHFDNIHIYHTSDVALLIENAIYLDIKHGEQIHDINETTCFINNKLNIKEGVSLQDQIHIGFQRHFQSKSEIIDLDLHELTVMSLGKIRSNKDELEPILRDVNQVHINISVLKHAEVPNSIHAYPTGLTTEELCQITKYVGGATKLKSITIDPDLHDWNHFSQEHKVIALIIWYLLEGIQNGMSDHPELTKNHSSFIVEVDDHDVEFVRHNQTHRYWAKIKDKYVATTHDEYTQTISGQVPMRIARLLD
jgi:formiminoglutamase